MSEPDYFSQEASARRRSWRTVRAEHPELFTEGTPDPEPAPIVVQAAPASDVTGKLPRSSGASTSPIIPLLLIGFGGYLLWFGVKYWRGTGAAVWPSYPIKSVLQGKGLPGANPAPTASATLATYEATLPTSAGTPPNPAGPGPVPPPSGGGGQPQNVARLLLAGFGWGADQMAPLISLWNQESGWSPTAKNPSSGALGIAQALGHATPGSGGSLGDEYGAQYGLTTADAQAANSGSALQQIRWGLGYIKSRYGNPAAAWAHEQAFNWY